MDSRLFLSRTFHRILEHPLGLVRLIIVLTSILAFGVVAYDLVTDRQRTEQAALDAARQQALVQSRAAAEMVQASLDRFDFALQTAREAAIAGPGAMAFQEQVIARPCPRTWPCSSFASGPTAISSTRPWGRPRATIWATGITSRSSPPTRPTAWSSAPRAGPAHPKMEHPGRPGDPARRPLRRRRRDCRVARGMGEAAGQLRGRPPRHPDPVDARGHVLLRTLDGASHFGKQAPRSANTSCTRNSGRALRGPRLGGWRPARVWLDAPAQPRAGDAVGDRPRRRPRPGA
jgi:hypothetical protein